MNITDNSVDQQVLVSLLKNLVTEPDKVNVERKIDEQGVLLLVSVAPADMGIVIGRSGSMASAIKTLMRAVGKANKMNVRIQFLEPDGTVRYSARKDNYSSKNSSNDKFNDSYSKQISDENIEKVSSSLDDDLKDFVVN